MKTPRRITLALAFALPLIPLTSAAQQPPDTRPSAQSAQNKEAAKAEASRRFSRGIELFQEGDYRAALIEFKRANELAPNYVVLYNIGNVYFQLQDYANALISLEQYLAQGSNNIDAKRRAEVEKDIEKLRTRVARLDVRTNVPDAEIAIDDVSIGKTPFTKPVLVNPGRHRIMATKEGRQPASKVVEVASFDSETVTLDLAEQALKPEPSVNPLPTVTPPVATTAPTTTATTSPPPPPPPSRPVTWPGWVVTAGLAVGAGVTGGLALSKSNDLKDLREPASGATRQQLDDAASSTRLLAAVTDGLIAGAVVAGAVTLIFTLRDPKPAMKTGTVSDVRVGVSPTGVQLSGKF